MKFYSFWGSPSLGTFMCGGGKVFNNYYCKYIFPLHTLSFILLTWILTFQYCLWDCVLKKNLSFSCSDWIISTDLSQSSLTDLPYFHSAIASFQWACLFLLPYFFSSKISIWFFCFFDETFNCFIHFKNVCVIEHFCHGCFNVFFVCVSLVVFDSLQPHEL